MTLLLIILAVLTIGFGVTFFLMKTGKIEDKDGNNIPDVIDTKIKETKEIVEDVKVKVKRVKEETGGKGAANVVFSEFRKFMENAGLVQVSATTFGGRYCLTSVVLQ